MALAREPTWMRGLSSEKEEAKARVDAATRAARAERDSRLGGYFGHPDGMSPEEIRRVSWAATAGPIG